MNEFEPHCKVSVYATFLCLFQKRNRLNHPSKTTFKSLLFGLFILPLILLPELGYGQFTNCPNNNNDEPPYAAPGQVVTGLPVFLEIDLANFDNAATNDFCIGNSGADDTDDGCGTFVFKNINNPSATCGAEFCFTPRQGCGNALGNVY